MQHKLGYKDEGIRRKKYLCLATKEYVDEHVTGLLKEDFINYDQLCKFRYNKKIQKQSKKFEKYYINN